MKMIKHPDYWLEDGSVIIIVEDTAFRVYRSLITRLSPQFFSDCCQTMALANGQTQDEVSLPCFTVRSEKGIAKEDFEALIAHILHDITITEDTAFAHILRLFMVSSASKGNFAKIHCLAKNHLDAYMHRNPLDIDFSGYNLIASALDSLYEGKDKSLERSLKRALYYSYATQDGVTFEDGSADADPGAKKPDDAQAPVVHKNHLSKEDAAICERVMAQLSETFSPTLFQPPAALHMYCTDVYAALWMERAIQPAFENNGTANPFSTLRRLCTLDWKREADESLGERSQPCDGCLENMRQQWNDEAHAIWEMMDTWLSV